MAVMAFDMPRSGVWTLPVTLAVDGSLLTMTGSPAAYLLINSESHQQCLK